VRRRPRTATVTARRRSTLYALRGEEFLAAVLESQGATEVTEALVDARLGALGE
jgi:CRP-like cAMP-binding protein